MTKEKTEMERIDSMFNKSVWLIGIIWTITLGGGAFAFSTSFSYLDNLIANSEKKIEKISQGATEKIDAAVLETSKKITDELAQKIDVVRISNDIKNNRIPEIEADLDKTIKDLKNAIDTELGLVRDDISQTRNDVEKYSKLLSDLIKVQEVAETLEVQAYGIYIEPDLPQTGKPAQITTRIYAPKLEKNQTIKVVASMEFLGFEHKQTLLLIAGEFTDISFPMVLPKNINGSDILVGQGKYTGTLKITDASGSLLLAQKTGLLEIYK
ncbi:hypothetical protein [Shewanella sp. FJAT-52076]|uniref:hypothetical protein n=1 Tax=Shewanella sp. FJAT-52076 TaxID=2864202 RepID=UPI001C65ED01|nr:hypothetical protein [Shewanella sp. FJAT-52076]QYJ74680.1 hypothetical protein K0H79_15190 [Shewanella sp. FJAT-52076]